ncbi:MAG TPA: flagella basal body P-ring formation protein FlgA [Sandaracinaceae bacterium LLY-WYZ-13_1]|nr:flagella basal body P-ring formation protein FlgA [Sandaracinaceae bacterium LLY-WYZ-13_1]
MPLLPSGPRAERPPALGSAPRLVVAALVLALLGPAAAAAQSAVHLSEVVPALGGTELGALEVGPAPPPGGTRVIRRSDVLRALREAGRDPRGLAIPRATRIRREARALDGDRIEALSRDAVVEALAPCRLEELTVRGDATVAAGPLEVTAEGQAPRRSGAASVMVILSAGGREVRVPAQARVRCPAPVVRPGRRVRLRVRFGAVIASAPGVARQPGRVGEVIRVQNLQTRASLRARVIDAETVEVVQ